MEAIADLVLALLDLLNAEVKSLRRIIIRIVLVLGLLGAGFLLFLGGVSLLIYSLYLHLAGCLGPPGSAAISGGIFIAAAIIIGVIAWLTR